MHILLALFPSFSRRLTGYPPISRSPSTLQTGFSLRSAGTAVTLEATAGQSNSNREIAATTPTAYVLRKAGASTNCIVEYYEKEGGEKTDGQ